MMYWILGLENGRLTTMPKPDGGELLLPTLQSWKDAGVDVVVSLLTKAEIETAVLQQEESLCQQSGLQFINFPITDYGVPENLEATLSMITQLEQLVSKGKNIAVHCWGGIGRSTTIVAATLIKLGFEADTVFDVIGKARGHQVPDTKEQKQWVWTLPIR